MRHFLTTIIMLSGGIAMFMTACAISSTTKTVDDRPGLVFKNVPKDAVLYVDRIQVGNPAIYDGQHKVLRVEMGTHEVQVQTPRGTLLNEKIFFGGGETRTLQLNGTGEKQP